MAENVHGLLIANPVVARYGARNVSAKSMTDYRGKKWEEHDAFNQGIGKEPLTKRSCALLEPLTEIKHPLEFGKVLMASFKHRIIRIWEERLAHVFVEFIVNLLLAVLFHVEFKCFS